MLRQEQRDFIIDLAAVVVGNMLRDIDRGRVPETWDGIELRQLLADRFAEQEPPVHIWQGKRKREYKNTMLVSNL